MDVNNSIDWNKITTAGFSASLCMHNVKYLPLEVSESNYDENVCIHGSCHVCSQDDELKLYVAEGDYNRSKI